MSNCTKTRPLPARARPHAAAATNLIPSSVNVYIRKSDEKPLAVIVLSRLVKYIKERAHAHHLSPILFPLRVRTTART